MPLFNMLANQWLGGSEKIKKNAKGLLSDIKDAPRQIGLLFDPKFQKGLLDQMSVTDKIDKDKAVATALEATGMAPMGLAGHIVYHGSPHKFTKFDMSKIGTGEGAQAYGHGLYFAESPGVAKNYAETLQPKWYVAGEPNGTWTAETMNMAAHNPVLGEQMKRTGFKTKEAAQEYIKQMQKEGNFYKVDIPDEAIPRMLDWNKPLSEQAPEVQKLFGVKHRDMGAEDALFAKAKELGVDPATLPEYGLLTQQMDAARPFVETTGDTAYRNLVNDVGRGIRDRTGPYWDLIKDDPNRLMYQPSDVATKYLRQRGIPGIRYLDGYSQAAGQGTSNYVLFDDQLARILEINGQPTGLLPWGK